MMEVQEIKAKLRTFALTATSMPHLEHQVLLLQQSLDTRFPTELWDFAWSAFHKSVHRPKPLLRKIASVDRGEYWEVLARGIRVYGGSPRSAYQNYRDEVEKRRPDAGISIAHYNSL